MSGKKDKETVASAIEKLDKSVLYKADSMSAGIDNTLNELQSLRESLTLSLERCDKSIEMLQSLKMLSESIKDAMNVKNSYSNIKSVSAKAKVPVYKDWTEDFEGDKLCEFKIPNRDSMDPNLLFAITNIDAIYNKLNSMDRKFEKILENQNKN